MNEDVHFGTPSFYLMGAKVTGTTSMLLSKYLEVFYF